MKKLEKYDSFDDLKDESSTGRISPAELAARQRKLESFIHFLRGDGPAEQSLSKDKTSTTR
ncbi:hypothetical protein SAMN04487996_13717 [Dyadobacter soli]|uniref:Uncharacterized protein n=1 Tax=Dyadobacter soli TaxID=659014 RepID=A0A1G8CCR2_9BACT|nr:hypothetical protein [Dyadobacter soli]SDH43222.1 hypothetical protein SAMN04487996_13717 [Dyadobacter soli]